MSDEFEVGVWGDATSRGNGSSLALKRDREDGHPDLVKYYSRRASRASATSSGMRQAQSVTCQIRRERVSSLLLLVIRKGTINLSAYPIGFSHILTEATDPNVASNAKSKMTKQVYYAGLHFLLSSTSAHYRLSLFCQLFFRCGGYPSWLVRFILSSTFCLVSNLAPLWASKARVRGRMKHVHDPTLHLHVFYGDDNLLVLPVLWPEPHYLTVPVKPLDRYLFAA